MCYDCSRQNEKDGNRCSPNFRLLPSSTFSLSHSTGGRWAAGREPYHVICATFSSPIPAAATCCARVIRKYSALLSTRVVAGRLYSLCASTTPHGRLILLPLRAHISLTPAVCSAQAAVGLLSLSLSHVSATAPSYYSLTHK